MDPTSLKAHIIETGASPRILTALGCHKLHEYEREWRAALPGGHNPTAVCLQKESLRCHIRDAAGERRGDIFTITMELCGCGFAAANKKLHTLLGLACNPGKTPAKPTYDPLEIFKRAARQRRVVNGQDMPVYDEGIVREYVPALHISWVREGITPRAQRRFSLGYSLYHSRIVIPERLWYGGTGDYVGIMGRTTVPEYKLLGIPKYYPLKRYPKGQNLYGLNENYTAIQAAGECTVFESQKSVLKRCSRMDDTTVAIGSSTITEIQARILVGLDVDITVALDEGLPLEHIFQQCDMFWPLRRVFYIHDTWGLLDAKESPADKPDKVYSFLHKYRKPYGPAERKILHAWQEKQNRN